MTKGSKKFSKAEIEEKNEREHKRDLMKLATTTEDIDMIIELTRHEDAEVRLKAAQQLCPCRVKEDYEEFWDRLFEMVEDTDPKVRMQAFHNICDGSPPRLECRVKEALDKLNGDPDSDIRRKVHKVMSSFLRSGDWNIL